MWATLFSSLLSIRTPPRRARATRPLQLPMIYCIENNQYGMGTSKERSSSNSTYYTMGNHIPGFKLDGMNILMIREVGVGFSLWMRWRFCRARAPFSVHWPRDGTHAQHLDRTR